MIHRTHKYTILSFIVTITTIASIWLPVHWSIGSFILCAYIVVHGFAYGQWLFPHESTGWQKYFGSLFLVASITSILATIYVVDEFSTTYLTAVLGAVSLGSILCSKKFLTEQKKYSQSFLYEKTSWRTLIAMFMTFIGQALLLGTLFLRRSGDTIISPWTLVGPRFFILFFLTTIFLFFTIQHIQSKKIRFFLIITHYLLFFCVSAIVYVHGYGFDPIIHEATVRWIMEHGTILPKQPYYIGEYMMLATAFHISKIPLSILNIWLVPFLAGICLPLSLYIGTLRNLKSNYRFSVLLLALTIPLSFFIQTTPNNLALLVATILILYGWYQHYSSKTSYTSWIFGYALVCFTTSIHPFIGIPLGVVYTGFFLFTRSKKNTVHSSLFLLFFICLTIILPLIFFLNGIRTHSPITIVNPLNHIERFRSIFATPHWFLFDNAPILWKILYHIRSLITPAIIGVGTYGIWKHADKAKKMTFFWLTTTLGLMASAFILATALEYPDVIGYEQHVYAARIASLALVTFIPFIIIGFEQVLLTLSKTTLRQRLSIILLPLTILLSWYFTYPTRDPISKYTGYSIRDADIEAVRFIDTHNNHDTNYIVLSNQTVASAAMKELSFKKYIHTSFGEQFFYSIPTGGPLYQFFRKMVYEEPKRQWMVEAMNFAQVDKAYFIHTNYWYPAAKIRDEAKKEADAWWDIGNGRVWIYEYTRRTGE